MSFQKKNFGFLKSGKQANLYTLSCKDLEVSITDYGASVVSIKVPDQYGQATDVVLGYDSAASYEAGSCFFGAVVGRVANRIGGAAFTLNGTSYLVDANEGKNCLHGGFHGYDKRIWEVVSLPKETPSLTLRLVSPSLDQGFPGNLELQITYTLGEDRSLHLHYRAVSDQDTLLNVTNHSYFNLNGHSSGSILGHSMQIYSDAFTSVQDRSCIPDGQLLPVEGTVFDFRAGRIIGQDIDADDPQLTYGGGYDHNFAVGQTKETPKVIARAMGDRSGIRMETISDLPGVQFYAGNSITAQAGKDAAVYGPRCGFCLETQFFPNCINTPGFEPCILKAGTVWESTTIYKFQA